MDNRGLLVPPWYVSVSPNDINMNICSIIWGFSLCCAVFTGTKATSQSWAAHKKGKLLTAYPMMVWAEWISSVTISVLSWVFLKGITPPSFWIFFFILCFWVVQMHCILQIIINRVSLVMVNKVLARNLKLGVFLIVLLINISVFCIWLPARLQISKTYMRVNDIWDRTEKAIFAVVDAGLNCYFMWTVRTNLISAGLVKYQPLFRFNLMMVCISVALDIVLIGSMSIGTGVIYIQFHPLIYLIKLHIELNMAELIAKVVRASNPINTAPRSGSTSCLQPSVNRNSHASAAIMPTHSSGYTSTQLSKEIDIGEQAMKRYSGADYHMAIRPNLGLHNTGDTILDELHSEPSDTAHTNDTQKKLSAV
ncbi:hypothetical protein AB5N19_07330 [Seiridium cardinale]|uniref:Transmembrane protein n=1 Tax=Seiridium cardinale TaxID=138064 RepID=A0ABR2Y445_9PEZI